MDIRHFQRSIAIEAELACVDLFSGAGGLGVGFRDAGWGVLSANDLDAAAGETFRLNFPEASFFEGKVSDLDARDILDDAGLEPGELGCLVGGPPCQSFSHNNHQRSAEDERARLFEHYLALVGGLNPKTLVMENVPGIRSIGGGAILREIEARLRTLGYDVAVGTLSAEEFGTPQVRRRVIIVASRVGPAAEMLPEPTHWSPNFRIHARVHQKRPLTARQRLISVWQAIGDLPALENGGGELEMTRAGSVAFSQYQRAARRGTRKIFNHVCNRLTKVNMDRIVHIPEGGNWRSIPFDLLPAGMQRAHPQDHTKRYGRLERTGLASTLLTKCDPHWGAYIHPVQDRTLSVREAARLQGFPDRFQFAGGAMMKHFVQVGNAVPVPMAKAIGVQVAKHIRRHNTITCQITRRAA
ncbi:DNA cytosine methyltransferase [Alteriqipengyuania sp. 357]